MTMNTTAPIREVTTPIGSSSGLSTLRAARSASIRNSAPANAETGSSRRWFGPTASRTMWGIISPTKATLPPMETHTPISADAQIITVSFTRRTGTPTCCAFSSPTAKAFSSRPCRSSGVPSRTSPPSSTAACS